MVLGENLKRLRTQKGLTLSALASASGLTKGFISQVETGQSTPSLASLEKLASALGTLPEDLISGTHGDPPQAVPLRLAYPNDNQRAAMPGLQLIERVGDTNYNMCNLDVGSRLVLSGGRQTGSAKALIMVKRGSIRIRQAGTDLSLAEGDVGTWNAAGAYVIENNSARSAAFLICLPYTAIPPRLEAGSPITRIEGPAATLQAEGPFRLIAMRSERRLVGRS